MEGADLDPEDPLVLRSECTKLYQTLLYSPGAVSGYWAEVHSGGFGFHSQSDFHGSAQNMIGCFERWPQFSVVSGCARG